MNIYNIAIKLLNKYKLLYKIFVDLLVPIIYIM